MPLLLNVEKYVLHFTQIQTGKFYEILKSKLFGTKINLLVPTHKICIYIHIYKFELCNIFSIIDS